MLRLLTNRRVLIAALVIGVLVTIALWPETVSVEVGTVLRGPLVVTVDEEGQTRVRDRFVVVFEGHFKRNYIHVRDVARVFLHGIDHYEKVNGQVFNVGLSDANVSKKELCEVIKKHVSDFTFVEAPVGRDPDQRNYIVSNAKIEATGYRPRVSLDDGVRELIKGFTMIRNSVYGNV